jgi:hypothetical protein
MGGVGEFSGKAPAKPGGATDWLPLGSGGQLSRRQTIGEVLLFCCAVLVATNKYLSKLETSVRFLLVGIKFVALLPATRGEPMKERAERRETFCTQPET